ncbi:MAG: sugar phosphate isomerase/epimerase [Burkholderiales bacterium]|nr:sugar phosphate isomerase/epimerase [Phycisphaerae bacterium]
MNLGGHDIGVCSWSLKPASATELVAALDALQLDHTQLALRPLLEMEPEHRRAELDVIARAEIALTAGMLNFEGENYASIGMIRKTGGFVPADLWPSRRDLVIRAADLAAEIGVDRVSVHLGFLPPGSDPGYPMLIERATELAQAFGEKSLTILFETGQERASDLLQFLNDLNCRNVAVNLDPANMLIYGSGDPVEAVHTLDRHIGHVHIKDAITSTAPGVEWGEEVPFGTGDIDQEAFCQALHDANYAGPLVIECETDPGDLEPIRTAIGRLAELFGGTATQADTEFSK